MKKAPIPHNEHDRLKDLEEYNILDTKNDPVFDDITTLASVICKTPIALISLIDENRQWFKSKIGLNAPETPRDISFCGHAIHESTLFEVENALAHTDFKDNPLVTGDPRVIYYAGQPLVSPKGNRLGTLCVIDHSPKKLSDFQKKTLDILSRQVVQLLELHKKNIEINIANQRLIKQAKRIKDLHLKSVESAKNNSLGQMAKGLSHEINNPLAIISMTNERMKEILQGESIDKKQLLEFSERISKTVERIGQVTYGMRSFIQGDEKGRFGKANLKEVLDFTLSTCQEQLKDKNIELILEGEFDQSIDCQKAALARVFYNLLMNSLDAVMECDQKWIKIMAKTEGNTIKITIMDSGKGIEKKYRQRIFDPFFSTKEVGEGKGLGLSSSRGVIKKHAGHLKLDEAAPFTSFSFKIPIKQNV